MDEFNFFQEQQGEWAAETFKNQTVDGKLAHLIKEVGELRDDPTDILEFADCLMLLLDAARLQGITATDILINAWYKLGINKQREWGQPNADGSVEHISEANSDE